MGCNDQLHLPDERSLRASVRCQRVHARYLRADERSPASGNEERRPV